MIFSANPFFLLIPAMLLASIASGYPLANVHAYPRDRSAVEQISSRHLSGSTHGVYQRDMRDERLHVRDLEDMLSESQVTARKIANEILGLIEQRGEEELNRLRRGNVRMSHEDEMACRDRGGTPERKRDGSAGCNMNPVPIRRTPWRKRKDRTVYNAAWQAGDGHGR
jgi:hypothetical protein